jgi:glycosyltransferase involved in cell wall biosynthesis
MITFANELAACGLHVDLVVGNSSGPYREEIATAVSLVELGSPRVSGCLLPLIAYLRRHRPTWLLSTMSHANVGALAGNYLAGRPTKVWIREATTLTQSLSKRPRWLVRALTWTVARIYSKADGILAPSQGVADDLKSLSRGALTRKLHVLMNPIPTQSISQLARDPVPLALEQIPQPWIVGCGRLDEAKSFDVLIHAVARLTEAPGCSPSLIILGEGEKRDSLERLAERLGISGRTHLPGFVQNPFSVLGRAAVFVLSSNFEGCPNVLLQAMACGTSVVATDCRSGPREILQREEQGLLVPVDDVEGLSRAIVRQLEHPGDRSTICARAEAFAAPAITRQLLQLLRSSESSPLGGVGS